MDDARLLFLITTPLTFLVGLLLGCVFPIGKAIPIGVFIVAMIMGTVFVFDDDTPQRDDPDDNSDDNNDDNND